MRKGTFSAKRAGSNSAAHNSRENAPKYLIGLQPDTQNFYELIQSDNDFVIEAQKIYKEKIGQNMQTKQIPNLVQETVLTLKENQNEKDVKELFQKLHKKFGGHTVLEISVHRDEGHFEKDGIAYYLTKNMIVKDNEYFIRSNPDTKDFDKKVNINDFEKVYNHHAHVKFSMFDKDLGKTARMQKADMSDRIKFVSEELGLRFEPDSKTSHIAKPVHQIKDEHHAIATVKEKAGYNFREMQKQITALENTSVEDKKELHKLNTQVSKGNATVQELEEKIAALSLRVENREKVLIEILPTAKKPSEVLQYVQELKNDLSQALQDKRGLEMLNDTLITEKMDSRGNQSDLNKQVEELKNENESLKKENEKLSWYKKQYLAVVSSLKTWTKLDDIKAVMQNLKERFEAPKEQDLTVVKELARFQNLVSEKQKAGELKEFQEEFKRTAGIDPLFEQKNQIAKVTTTAHTIKILETKYAPAVTREDVQKANEGYEQKKYRGPDLTR
jgi:hypothetical protein